MNNFEVFNNTDEELKELDTIKNLLNYAIEVENISDIEFNVIIVDNEKIHELNKNYRGIDRPTDVISFALEDNKDFGFSDYRILGDIYISLDKVHEQSEEYGHSFLRELSFLVVHGFLHLLGYDHVTDELERVMFERQELILDGFGIKK